MSHTLFTILSLNADFRVKRYQQANSAETAIQPHGVTNPHGDAQGPQGRVSDPRKSQPPPPPRQNGFMAADDPGHDGLTYYGHSKPSPGRQVPARRQKSLPSRRMQGDENERQAISAPSRKAQSTSRKAPLPQLNTLVARSRGPAGGESGCVVTTNFAGYSTKDHEASPTRYTRFASTWAQVRAENHIDMCAPASRESLSRKTPRSEEGHGSVDRDTIDQWSRARSDPSDTSRYPDRQQPHLKDHRGPRSRQEMTTVHSQSPRKDNTAAAKPAGVTHRKKSSPRAAKAAHQKRKESRDDKEIHTARFDDDNDENDEQNEASVATETSDGRDPKSGKKKPVWNNRLALSVPHQTEPPVKSWRRYEAELTHAPTLTSTKEVYKAYTGRSKQQLRNQQMSAEEDEPDQRPSTKGSLHREESGELLQGYDPHSPGEHILTRNEAKMFLHLQNVYGSEAYRQQRKGWFFKKLTDVQLQELQQQAADRRRKQHKADESKKRQKRQLMFVRRKFRREQLHRFRTQYVTSRVLEHEKMDRDMYGLPDDSDDDDIIISNDIDDIGEEDPQIERLKTKDSSQWNTDSDRNNSKDSSQWNKDSDRNNSKDSSQWNTDSDRDYSKDSSQWNKDSDKNDAKTVSKPRVKGSPGEESQRANKTDKCVSGASKSKAFVGSTKGPSSGDTDTGLRPVDDTNASTTIGKNSVQVNTASLPQQNAGKPVNVLTATKNSKQSPNSNQVNGFQASESKQKSIITGNDNNNNSSSTHTDAGIAKKQQKISSDTAKTAKQDPEKAKTAKDTATITRPNMDTTVLLGTKSSPTATSTDRNTASTADSPGENVSSSLLKDRNTPAIATSTGAKNRANAAQPAASSSKATGSKSQGGKTENESRDKHSGAIDRKDTEDSLPTKDNRAQKNKNVVMKTEKSGIVNGNKDDSTSAEKHNGLPNKHKDDSTFDRSKTKSVSGNKRTVNGHENKHLDAVTAKDSGSKDLTSKTTSNTVSSKDLKGHASDTSQKPVFNNPTAATSPETKDGYSKSSPAAQKDVRGRKRKPAQAHVQPKNEDEQKKQLERKYGKMFDVNAGPSWNPGAKPPKMEGIDTVVVKVTDEKGRTRLKKREVKDVVKEAKAQLAIRSPEKGRRSSRKAHSSDHQAADAIRPASADTLDFEDDDDDDEEEDVFERVRRKYNLQIDSDDDSVV
ncbi:hypothetical protein ACOMHN_062768 [Nucella lapillus]